MPLSWNEIHQRSKDFARDWSGETHEHAEAKPFWEAFFSIFGISRRRLASYEFAVKKTDRKYGFIDLFWKGHLLVEHKSRGKSLEKAYHQGLDYFAGLKEEELPRYVIVCDFQRFGLYDLEENEQHFFALEELPQKIHLFGFIAGYTVRKFKDEDPINIEAALRLGKVHDALEAVGYTGKPLERFMVRLAFCLFADDSGIFEKDHFHWCIENHTREDGFDLGAYILRVFDVLDTPPTQRQSNLDEDLAKFPYVNGSLFTDVFRSPATNGRMREALLHCLHFNWAQVSPDIFGSLFQSVMNPKERRDLGAHYTSEKNILKVIDGLFLGELAQEFEEVKTSKNRLSRFLEKIRKLTFLDPACGSGNFLVVTYREMRRLELRALKAYFSLVQFDAEQLKAADIASYVKINVEQFYGIEIDEFAANIAEVALWMTDHQMNEEISREFGQYYVRIPISQTPTIVQGNALRLDWKKVVSPKKLSYILGNPPFIGSKIMTAEQRADLKAVAQNLNNVGVLDYVTAWYLKAAEFIQHTKIKVAFVSTNSISQGEQTGILWAEMLNRHTVTIQFAHRTFQWSNEAPGVAAVYCVIIGFAAYSNGAKILYDYETVKSDPVAKPVKNISPYLIEFDNVLVQKRTKPLCNVPEMHFGNMPLDGNHLLLNDEEKKQLLIDEPEAEPYIRPLISSKEFLNGIPRWCIWLKDVAPEKIRGLKFINERIQQVKRWREAPERHESTHKFALTPTLFRDTLTPERFLVIPSTSSENRNYIPIGFCVNGEIANNSCHIIPEATLYHFGILTSAIHMAWVRQVCGRLKSDFRYSKDVVYNNFPWPEDVSDKQQKNIAELAQNILDLREKFPQSSLADLYDPLFMPPELVKAHQKLDRAVDLCYRKEPFPTELSRLQFLFELYRQYTEPLLKDLKPRKNQKK
jgi:hypothetical protein